MTLTQLRKLADVKNAKIETERYYNGWGYWLLKKDGGYFCDDNNYHSTLDELNETIKNL